MVILKMLFKDIVTPKLISVTVIECFIWTSYRKMTCKIFKSTHNSFQWTQFQFHSADLIFQSKLILGNIKTKRRRSDPVLWQKPLHQQKCQKGKVTTQTTPQKSSIKQQLRTDSGRSVGVITATQLLWLTSLRNHLRTPRNSRVIKRTHI